MAKVKERSEVEFLRSQNKQLRSENRNLKKQINRTNKKVKAYEENIDLEEPDMPEILLNDSRSCSTIGCAGIPVVTDLGAKSLVSCSDCGYRKTVKK